MSNKKLKTQEDYITVFHYSVYQLVQTKGDGGSDNILVSNKFNPIRNQTQLQASYTTNYQNYAFSIEHNKIKHLI